MAPVQDCLRFATDLLDLANIQLQRALNSAIMQEYDSDWIAGIRKAFTSNHDTLTHLGNVQTLLHSPNDPPPYVVKPHMLKYKD